MSQATKDSSPLPVFEVLRAFSIVSVYDVELIAEFNKAAVHKSLRDVGRIIGLAGKTAEEFRETLITRGVLAVFPFRNVRRVLLVRFFLQATELLDDFFLSIPVRELRRGGDPCVDVAILHLIGADLTGPPRSLDLRQRRWS